MTYAARWTTFFVSMCAHDDREFDLQVFRFTVENRLNCSGVIVLVISLATVLGEKIQPLVFLRLLDVTDQTDVLDMFHVLECRYHDPVDQD